MRLEANNVDEHAEPCANALVVAVTAR